MMNKFENCKTKEEIMEIIFKGGDKLEASKQFLKIGLTDESIKFYLLSEQENFLNIFHQQLAGAEEVSNTNKIAGQFMIEAAEKNQRAVQTMNDIADFLNQSTNRMSNISESLSTSSNRIQAASELFSESSYRIQGANRR